VSLHANNKQAKAGMSSSWPRALDLARCWIESSLQLSECVLYIKLSLMDLLRQDRRSKIHCWQQLCIFTRQITHIFKTNCQSHSNCHRLMLYITWLTEIQFGFFAIAQKCRNKHNKEIHGNVLKYVCQKCPNWLNYARLETVTPRLSRILCQLFI
jgi:hypothetical protein